MKLKVEISVRVPQTADEWELYTSSMKCGSAARALTAALKKSMRLYAKDSTLYISDALEPFYVAARKWSKYGADDSEPHYHARDVMRRLQEQLGRSA